MKKSIAIDCSKLNTNYRTGTHRFLIGFLDELVKNNKDFDFYFYVNGKSKFLEEFSFFKKGKIVTLNYPKFYTQVGLLKELGKYDYFIFPWQTLPFFSFFTKCHKISIIHDLGYSFKSQVTTLLTLMFSDQIYSVSKSTAQKIPRKSTIIGEGVSEKLFYPVSSNDLKPRIKELEIPNFFILSLGRIEKRKNIYNNLTAFSLIKKYYPNLKYVFIGSFVEDEEKVYSFIDSLGLAKSDVLFKINISDIDLNFYLNSMEFLVFTSLDEGFGLPVLEAYAVNKPVLLSKIQQLADFKISANQYVDPNDPIKISEKMIKFLNKEHGIKSKRDFKEVLSRFSWKTSTEIFLKSLK